MLRTICRCDGMADIRDLKSLGETRAGSSPASGTKNPECDSVRDFYLSGTSIGANIREAMHAHGKADFTAKLQIA